MAEARVAAGDVGHAGRNEVRLPRCQVIGIDRRTQRPVLRPYGAERDGVGERVLISADIEPRENVRNQCTVALISAETHR